MSFENEEVEIPKWIKGFFRAVSGIILLVMFLPLSLIIAVGFLILVVMTLAPGAVIIYFGYSIILASSGAELFIGLFCLIFGIVLEIFMISTSIRSLLSPVPPKLDKPDCVAPKEQFGEKQEVPNLSISISHRLSRDEALGRIKNLLKEVKNEFADKISDLEEEWEVNSGRFSFSAMGFRVSGQLIVGASDVQLTGKLPFAATFFKNKIKTVVRERAKKLLA